MSEDALRLMEKFDSLPAQEKAKVEELVNVLHTRVERTKQVRDVSDQGADLDRARISMRWVREHREEYLGKWVALDGGRLVASGETARQVYQDARRQGVDRPFVNRVTAEPTAVWGGWL